MAKRVFRESDVNRDEIGRFAEEAAGKVAKAGAANKAFLAAFSAKLAKKAAAGDGSGGGSGLSGLSGVKGAPVETLDTSKLSGVKLAGPDTLPKKKGVSLKRGAPIVPAAPARNYREVSGPKAEALQRRMLRDRPWTANQRQALTTYTGEDYIGMNDALRRGGGTPRTRATITSARAAMREVPEDVTVHRAMGAGSAFGFDRDRPITPAMLDALVGRTWSDPGFTSTTTEEGSYGGNFNVRVHAKINVPSGTRGAFVEDISENPGENEFILDAGTHFKITGYERHANGNVTLHMEVASQDA